MKHLLTILMGSLFFAPVSLLADSKALESMKERIAEIVKLKESGVIGERLDGLVGLVKEDEAAKKIVEAENADRLKVYETRARSQKVDLETFKKVIGSAKVREEKSGRFVESEAGVWSKKP